MNAQNRFTTADFLSIFSYGTNGALASGLIHFAILNFIVMKRSKILFPAALVLSLHAAPAQTIVGDWQLVKQGSCLEGQANGKTEELKELRKEMHAQTSAGQRVVSFKSNASGEESTRILNSGKSANQKKFLYKFSGEMLLILDKKSQTISDSYLVDKFTADSLIISNASRPCETMIFVKITEAPPN